MGRGANPSPSAEPLSSPNPSAGCFLPPQRCLHYLLCCGHVVSKPFEDCLEQKKITSLVFVLDENWDAASTVLRLGGLGGRDGSSRADWEVSADCCCSSPASPRSWRPCWAMRWCRWPVVHLTSWQSPTNGKCLPGAGGIMVRDSALQNRACAFRCLLPLPSLALLARSRLQMCQARWVWKSCRCFTT